MPDNYTSLRICVGCLSELDSELDSDWVLEKSWDSGLPERTPMCTAGCEGFLHLPLSSPQQTPQYEEPLLVLGIDLRALENTLGTSTIGTKCYHDKDSPLRDRVTKNLQ